MDEHGVAAARWRWLFFSLWGGLLLLKLGLATTLPLFGDEAFYWLESRHLALAYDDVPAATPWLIAAGIALFGDGTLALRLPFLAIGAFTAWWLARIVAADAGPRAGWLAGSVALLLPLFAINGLLALPDVPLTLAVLACVEGLRRLDRSDGGRGRLLLAAGLALGWLSHYRFLLAFAAGGGWLLLTADGRRLLRQPRVWTAGLLGTLVGLAPLLWHQWQRGGSGFAFQFAERHPFAFQPKGLLDPLLQAAVVTPGLFVLLLAVFVGVARRPAPPGRGPLHWIAGALLLGIWLLAPFVDTERSRLHWLLPAWLLLVLLLPVCWPEWTRRVRRWAMAALGLAAALVVLSLVYLGIVAASPQQLAASPLYPHNFAGWAPAAARVREALAALPDDTVLAADNFMLAAQLSFALDARPVYSLDHPLNTKHGRQGELRRWRLDEAALVAAAAGRPLLLLLEESATRLRARPDWYRRLCERYPGARPQFDLPIDHGRKRLIGYLQRPGVDAGCAPPAVGHLDQPQPGERIAGELVVSGWALRDRVGIARVWLLIDGERVAELPYRLPMPGVQEIFPRSDDPNHPAVGFALRWRPSLVPGRHWLAIEAEGEDGVRSVVGSAAIEWVGD
jgi:4-amino-4-deoxy-L-arabinose transferase-like glycosyltransferase